MDPKCRRRDDRARGQIIVLFALAAVVIIAAVGLVLDGGAAFAQRRSEQTAADMAAIAGANDYLINHDVTLATNRARMVAGQNGYTHGSNSTTVDVVIVTTNGVSVQVDISAPHANNFASVVGMANWTVSVTATAQAGYADTGTGGAPMIFSIDAFESNGQPKAQYGSSGSPYDFGETNGDVPTGPGDFAWTNYGTGNVNTSDVRAIIGGTLVITKTIDFGDYIGQHNNGNHTALYDKNKPCEEDPSINGCYAGTNVVVPVVDHNGNFQGWATFHVVSASGGSSKDVTGYFVSNFVNQRLSVGSCSLLDCPRFLGSYVLKLTN